MPDEMTAAARASGIGATEQTDKNAEKIADLLDQVRDLMVEDGADPATAEALTNFARPNTPQMAGNLADLMRMGQIAVQGEIDTPPGEPNIEATNLEAAFEAHNPRVTEDVPEPAPAKKAPAKKDA